MNKINRMIYSCGYALLLELDVVVGGVFVGENGLDIIISRRVIK